MRIGIFITAVLLCWGCGQDGGTSFRALDLTEYNIPVTIQAPDSARVVAGKLSGIIEDVTVKSPADRYAVQILASTAATNDMTRLKATELEAVRDNRYFERIVSEDPAGFIFENKIDTTSAFGFRYIVYQGDREIVFQNTFDGVYTLDETTAMYNSVKPTE
ncbi:hypothetical protein LEM8419_01252 [Neolewinella maritima]|uniref:Uncharacterized protein n=1 Tax=Neolewinella maritima TaxID=1383882 RepID=A0ABM9AZ71_9BACT|nr:hypothetical protein [Neolewinella maritima]CAH1000086.1 hypothetical protein LEM8419_01252 [Neolewinella maritima]